MIGRHRTLAAGFLLGALALSQTVVTAPARAESTSAGTYGAAFLAVPIGARAMSTPDVVAGLRPDASMVFGNPAGPARLDNTQVFFSTATWLEELNLSAGSAVIPFDNGLSWSLGSRVLYSGGLQGLDAGGNAVEEASFYDLALSSGLSKRFDEIGFALGAGVTYLREHQPLQTGTAVVFSAGASYEYAGNRFEVMAADFGADLSYEGQKYPIDSRVVLGYGRAFNRTWGTLDVGAQLEVSRSEHKRLEIGGAYHMNRFLTVRSGVQHSFSAPSTSEMPITAGLGFHYNAFSIDYAYTAQDYFPATHTFSFNYGFGRGSHHSPGSMSSFTTPTTSSRESAPAPVAAVPSTVGSSGQSKKGSGVSYLVVAGTHGRLESARAEVRALRLLNVPAVTEKVGGTYRVLIGRYDSLEDANRAANEFLKKGHRFEVIHEQP